jgi:hypothetical protein
MHDMTESQLLFIEATLPDDKGYEVVWRQPLGVNVDASFELALNALRELPYTHRLELWSKAHADSPKGFAPMAFREANSKKIKISGTLAMLSGLSRLDNP